MLTLLNYSPIELQNSLLTSIKFALDYETHLNQLESKLYERNLTGNSLISTDAETIELSRKGMLGIQTTIAFAKR
jgi:hypothetical protein